MKFEFADILTSDGVDLQGVFAGPAKTKKALIFVHGLTSSFYSNIPRLTAIAGECEKNGIAFYAFNNRGHDEVSRISKKNGKSALAGGWFESFTESVADIRAMVSIAYKRGAKEVYLAGHSTGANKAVYYMAKTNDRRVRGVALVGALSDVLAFKLELKGKFNATLKRAQVMYKKNKKAIYPPELMGGQLMSAERMMSLMTPGGTEDVFPYHGLGGKWTHLQKIQRPMLLVIGANDQHLDRPVKKYVGAFLRENRSKDFKAVVIAGARHGFTKHVGVLGKTLAGWVEKV